ncbi:MAG: tRNA pseudouridine(55) synthase TruB [Corynebacterium sp.]|uniref:tRNA pseudouridine(55) synthase TruB n=1 Tax=Corynebacterium sp. TaxID=1720 RepID=UPI0017EDC4B0|nr:tRNA pseudouridine(55) synthase TruB [Corynebacterium sp.]NWO16478.1 tRNA pseudouridine(55) synthase TruB [Corynebacterium sp.]
MTDSGLVVVDKPAGMTSHDVVSRVRREFGTRKVGHAGTLDPMATGVLILGIERGTKFLAHMVTATKAYNATISLGASTTTDDFEGEIISQTSAAHITDAEILSAIANLTGDIMQKPAKVSAIKIDGKRAYQRVRDGEDVDIPARPVTVNRFAVLESRQSPREVDVVVECSSGTYIRSLARDLGEALGVGGHLTTLRRTEVGPFSLDDASPLDSMELSLNLDEALVRCYPRLDVTAEESHKLAMGQWLEPRGVKGTYAAVGPDGRSIALVKEKGKRLSTVFVAHPSTL